MKINCHCGQELTKEELEAEHNKKYKNKMCNKCMWDYCNHAMTGE